MLCFILLLASFSDAGRAVSELCVYVCVCVIICNRNGLWYVKVKVDWVEQLVASLTAMGTHVPFGITQLLATD